LSVPFTYSTRADPPKIPLMVWFFQRGREHLRVETRRGRSGEFILILHQADGTQLVDRFKSQGKFRKRLHDLERNLARARWTARSAAERARSER
jgi:hypothetical protein